MRRSTLVRLLAAGRLAIGASALLAPRRAGRALGLDVEGNAQLPYLARLAGARDMALAYGTLRSDGQAQHHWLVAALASDTADALSGLAGGISGYLPKRAAVVTTASGAAAAALGALALRMR